MEAEIITNTALETISKLRELFKLNSFQFSMDCSAYLSGDHKKELRREIIYSLTGERRSLSKCGLFATEEVLKICFQQISLF